MELILAGAEMGETHLRLQIQNRAARRITIGAKIITHTTLIVGELILQLHTSVTQLELWRN